MQKLKLVPLLFACFFLGSLAAARAADATYITHSRSDLTRTRLAESANRRAAAGTAVRTVKSPIEPGLNLGLSGAVTQLASGPSSSIATWDSRARSVGTQIVRISISWSSIAPPVLPAGFDASNPDASGYNWSAVDLEVEDVVSAGFKPLIEVHSAPTWAEGPGVPAGTLAGTWEPNAVDFGQFATALATRFDGSTPGVPRVSYWQAWNEPNLSEFLTPQWTTSNAPASPETYRNLENAFYSSVKGVSSSNFVVAAGTAPYGDPNPGGSQMQPVTFDQNLFCLNSKDQPAANCPGTTALDAIDDHPYVSGLCCLGPAWHAQLAGDTSIPDVYKIVDVLDAAQKARTAVPSGAKQVWATELGWNTDPPNPDTNSASPPAQVGKWATQALYILWSQGVNTVFWYELADPASEPSGGWDSSYEEGLFYGNGASKPAALAFRFPFMTNRKTKRLVQAWGRAPKAGILWIQQEIHGEWQSLLKLKVKAAQVFDVPIRLTGSSTFRAVIGGIYSPVWAQAS